MKYLRTAALLLACGELYGQVLPPVPPPVREARPPGYRPQNRSQDIEIASVASVLIAAPSGTRRTIEDLLVIHGSPEPKPDGVTEVIRSNEMLIPALFNVTLGALDGYQVSGSPDTLIARWHAAGKAGIKSVTVRDSELESVFVLECNASALRDIRQFLTGVFMWRSVPLDLNWIDVARPQVSEQGPFVLRGHTEFRKSSDMRGQIFGFRALLTGDKLYLAVTVGKRLISGYYPAGFAISRHRFPPLSKMAESWSKEAILSELARLGSSDKPLDLFSSDAPVLVRELVRRNASDAELVTAVYDSTRFDEVRGVWLQALMGWPSFRGQLAKHQQFLTAILDKSRRKHKDCGGHPCARIVFSTVARDRSMDFQEIALNYAASALVASPALNYLAWTSASSETLSAVKNMVVPDKDAGSRDFAIRSITRRIQDGKKRTGGIIDRDP